MAILYGFGAFAMFIAGMTFTHPDYIAPQGLYATQVVYAVVIFLCALWLYGRQKIANGPITRFFADISYSLYLIHLPLSVFVSRYLFPVLGLTWAVLAALAVCIALSCVLHRLVERPSQQVGRMIIAWPTALPRASVIRS